MCSLRTPASSISNASLAAFSCCATLGHFVEVDGAGFNGVQQPVLPFLVLLELAVELIDAFLLRILGGLEALAQRSHHGVQPVRCEHRVGQLVEHHSLN